LLHEAANSASALTGGADGLQGVKMWPLFGMFRFDLYGFTAYWYALIVLFLLFLVCRRLINSPFGLSLRGIRENAVRMRAIGAESRPHIRTIYTISAAIAGIAGGIWAQANAYVNLGTLGLDRAATVLIILVLGGAGRLYGAFIGAVAYMALSHFLAKVYPTAWQLGLGLLLVVIALFARNGILGVVESLWRRRRAAAAGR